MAEAQDEFPSLKGFDLCLDWSVIRLVQRHSVGFHPSKGSTSV